MLKIATIILEMDAYGTYDYQQGCKELIPSYCIYSHLITHCAGGGANVDNFLVIGGSVMIFLTRTHMDCRRFFCLEVVDDLDFYPLSYLCLFLPLTGEGGGRRESSLLCLETGSPKFVIKWERVKINIETSNIVHLELHFAMRQPKRSLFLPHTYKHVPKNSHFTQIFQNKAVHKDSTQSH